MPIIPNYILQNEDLSSMDDLLQAKRKMLNRMKIEETEIKFDGIKNVDSKLILSNFDGADKLVRANIGLLKSIDNKISIPEDSTKGARLSSVYKETDITLIEVFDTFDKFNYNLDLLTETLTELLPFTKYIDNKKFDKFYDVSNSLRENFIIFTNTKVVHPIYGQLFLIVGNTRLKGDDFMEKFSITDNKFRKYNYIWEQYINQYKSQQKI